MKILSMTATFGKLDGETLELRPDLDIQSAPNEWGKSTWCAFLTAMLYGIDTRERTTQDTLAVKERYAPWSGAPMSGSMDINWNGRDITIERHSRGRLIFSEFKKSTYFFNASVSTITSCDISTRVAPQYSASVISHTDASNI